MLRKTILAGKAGGGLETAVACINQALITRVRIRIKNNGLLSAAQNVCFCHKADIARLSSNVRFWG